MKKYEPSQNVKDFLLKILYEKRSLDLKHYEKIASIFNKNMSDFPDSLEYLKSELKKIYGIE